MTQPTDTGDEVLRLREALRCEIINTPETASFMAGVPIEAAHQRERWASSHDAGKSPFDWFWLIGYLAQKAASAAASGDLEKAKHHTISTAAALANWHAALGGIDSSMRPGIDPAALSPQPHTSDVLSPSPVHEGATEVSRLRIARQAILGITDDYMTSEGHHPGYVLISSERFDRLRCAEAALAPPPADAIREPVSSDAGEDAT